MTVTIGPPLEDVLRAVLEPYGDDRLDQAVAAYREDYGTRGFLGSVPYPGVGEALKQIRGTGVQLYLVTSKRTVFARRILEHLDLAECFAGISGSEPGGALDHKPELIAHVLSAQGLGPETSVMVGDRSFDITGAHANRVRAAGVLWGYGSRRELESAGADRLVETAGHLAGALRSMDGRGM